MWRKYQYRTDKPSRVFRSPYPVLLALLETYVDCLRVYLGTEPSHFLGIRGYCIGSPLGVFQQDNP